MSISWTADCVTLDSAVDPGPAATPRPLLCVASVAPNASLLIAARRSAYPGLFRLLVLPF